MTASRTTRSLLATPMMELNGQKFYPSEEAVSVGVLNDLLSIERSGVTNGV